MTTENCMDGILHERDRILSCVHCGLCLPACPTYVATGNENDSPRGRIYLMRAVQEGKLAPDSPTFRSHIDRCLGCRACEAACPSGVEYGHLLEAARVDVESARPSGSMGRLKKLILLSIWPVDSRRETLMRLGRLFRASHLSALLIRSRIAALFSRSADTALRLLEGTRPVKLRIRAQPSDNPASATSERPAAVFRGCTAQLMASVDGAVMRVLEVNRFKTAVPADQTCCGALHAHSGYLEEARHLARRNIDAFASSEGPIVTSSGGCGAMLVNYHYLLAGDSGYAEAASRFVERVRDVGQVLQQPRSVHLEPNDEVVTYDASCHLMYGQHASEESLGMLGALEDLKIVPLERANVCCGGAGIYNLLEPELSDDVLRQKVDDIVASGATILATGNPGCHMQISRGLHRAGISGVRVCHPVELLDECYRSAGLKRRPED